MTREYLIDILLLFILVIHIIKIERLQKDNERIWRHLKMISQHETNLYRHLDEMNDTIRETLELLKDTITK